MNEVVTISWDTFSGNEQLVPSLSFSMKKGKVRLTSSSPKLRRFYQEKGFRIISCSCRFFLGFGMKDLTILSLEE